MLFVSPSHPKNVADNLKSEERVFCGHDWDSLIMGTVFVNCITVMEFQACQLIQMAKLISIHN